jgi:two-component system, sensor histidine kinase
MSPEIGAIALERLRLELLASAFRRAFVSTLVASACVGYLAHRGASLAFVLGWMALAIAAITLRRELAVRALRRPPSDPRSSLERLVIASGVVGAVHGAVAFAFLPGIEAREQAVVTMVVMCWCAGSLIIGSIAPRAYYAFVTLAAAPFALFWLFRGGDGGWVIAALIVLMFAMVGLFVRDAERVLLESFALRNQNEDLLRKLESASQRRASFIEFLNHDLRNALGVVGMSIATLALRPREESEQRVVEGARQGLDLARGLIDALDEIAQIDAGAIPVRPERVVPAEVAGGVARMFDEAARAKGLALTVAATSEAVLVDRRLLGRVLQNLVENAIKYTAQGTVQVRGRVANSRLQWEVEDSGPGIAPAERERVFEEFYQLDNPERSHAKGRGLGLSVVKRFVALMGGSVTIEEGVHGGVRFTVELPAPPAPSMYELPKTADATPRIDHAFTVWIIEDQLEVRTGLTRLVETLGYIVRAFDAPRAAMEALVTERPDAVLCDLRLSAGESGLAAAKALRRRIARLPVAIVTGEAATEQLEEVRTADFELLRKPLDADALARWLHESSHP